MSKNKDNREQELRVKLDQIMKNLFSVSSQVLINMLNNLFQEDYDPESTEIILTNNEFVLEYDEYDIIRGDVFFQLQDSEGRLNQYHIDFQTIYDKNMVLRMFAYGFNKAKELTTLQELSARKETIIRIPKQLVIYIEEHKKIGDELKLRIVFPDAHEKQYIVPVMKYWQYKTSELLEKRLYPLLPLQVFKLRKKLNQFKQIKHSPEQSQEILQEAIKIAAEAGNRSRSLYDKHVITGEDLNKILTALGNLMRYLQVKYEYVEADGRGG